MHHGWYDIFIPKIFVNTDGVAVFYETTAKSISTTNEIKKGWRVVQKETRKEAVEVSRQKKERLSDGVCSSFYCKHGTAKIKSDKTTQIVNLSSSISGY